MTDAAKINVFHGFDVAAINIEILIGTVDDIGTR